MGLWSAAYSSARSARLATAAARGEPCALCGHPINYTLPGRRPDGPSVDHIVPRRFGGDLTNPNNLRPAHTGCNARRGDTTNRRNRATPKRSPSRWW